jgi:hypothetical protein
VVSSFWMELDGGCKRSGLEFLSERRSYRGEVFRKSKSAIVVGWGGQRHAGAESGSSCCGSRDVGSARKSQGGASLELVARE